MTNGPGKSDSSVVPEKSPNNAGQPVAEGTEGRGRAKGNSYCQPDKQRATALHIQGLFFRKVPKKSE